VLGSIKEAISQDCHVGRLGIVVVEMPNAIVLRGTVRSYYLKQIATERAMAVLRNKKSTIQLQNEIVVHREEH